MKRIGMFLCVLLAASVLLSLCGGAVSALTNGQNVGIGTLSNVSSSTIGEGLTYAFATVDGEAGKQQIHTLEFNPKTSAYVPLVYSKFNGYGATVPKSAADAETKYGYDVKAGVNASFFSMATSANTYGGVNISDGKVIQGSNSFGETGILAFDSDGTAHLVQSRVAYALSVNGSAWDGALEHINIAPPKSNGEFVIGKKLYYWDTSCGTKTDTKAAGVEIVFEKAAGSELTVGGTLSGTVCEVRKNVSAGNPIGTNQFVLYASDASTYAAKLRALKVGDTATIRVTETVAASREVMENCSSAAVIYSYVIVKDGKNVTKTNGLGDAFNEARRARTGLGIKADGTLVIICTSDAATESHKRTTVYELADMLIAMGCVTGIDLDGGGSTQMVTENASGALESKIASSRSVANSLLIVKRPTIPEQTKQALKDKITQMQSHALASTSAVQAAVRYAQKVCDTAMSMPGDYGKAMMRLDETLQDLQKLDAAVEKAKAATETEYSPTALRHMQVLVEKAKTVDSLADIHSTTEALETLCNAKGLYSYNAALNKPYTPNVTGPHGTYPDSTGKEVTDGVLGIAGNGADTAWSGFQTQGVYVIDLGETVNGLYEFHAQFLALSDWGIAIPASVTYSVSDQKDGTYKDAGTVTKAQSRDNDYVLTLSESVSGRYVKCTVKGGGWMFIGEVQALARDHLASQHVAGNWVVTKNPTATEDGEKVKKCTVCGAIVETVSFSTVPGDVNGDGAIGANDCHRARRAFFKLVPLTDEILQAMDFNGNGKLDASDIMKQRRIFFGLI